MSANYDNKQKSIDPDLHEQLKAYLGRSWLKREDDSRNSSSVAITGSSRYFSGILESRTHLLDVTSEQAALAIATANKDPYVKEIVTLGSESQPNPLVIKTLADHVRRTGIPIVYSAYDYEANQLFSFHNVMDTYYSPEIDVLDKIIDWTPEKNHIPIDESRPLEEQLRECATKGMETHFSSTSKSCYGAAVAAGSNLYFGGVYSSFDHRMNLHSEMVAALSAFSQDQKNIFAVGVICNKFIDDVVHMCGCCRQFFDEIQKKTGVPIQAYLFSFDGSKKLVAPMDKYLPSSWNSGKPLEDRN